MTYEMIDVSNNNGSVDWKQVAAAGIKGAYCKASEGTGFTDSHYALNRSGCAAHSLHFGAYHFARPDQSSPSAEADHFLSVAQPKHGDLLPCLDFETSPMSPAWAGDFAARVHQKLGVYPLLYASGSAFPALSTNDTLRKCPIWIAAWGSSVPPVPHGWDEITLWQYSGHGHTPGVSGECDKDKAFKIRTYEAPLVGYDVSFIQKDGTRITEHLKLRTRFGRPQPNVWVRKHHPAFGRGTVTIKPRRG